MPISCICETCGIVFNVSPSVLKHDPPRFCCPECFYTWSKGQEYSPRVVVQCQTCGKEIRILKSKYDAGQGRFCSRACVNKGRPSILKKEKVKCICLHCGKEFYRSPGVIKQGRGKFCCRSCVASHTNHNSYIDKGPTSIELAVMQELDNRGIDYEPQYPVTKWIIDFAIPEYKIAIEADGVYWHSLENVIDKDARKDNDLKSNGWSVFHFDGDKIRSDVSGCIDEIVKYLQQKRRVTV